MSTLNLGTIALVSAYKIGGIGVLATLLGYWYLVEEVKMVDSIPRSIYWAIVTTTTVGYGDIYPVTVFGQILAAALMKMVAAIMKVPTGVSSELKKLLTK